MATYALKQQIGRASAQAKREAEAGADLRDELRRKQRPGAQFRQERLDAQIERLNEVGALLRSLVHSIPWPQYDIGPKEERRLRAASDAVVRERRKLRKMSR